MAAWEVNRYLRFDRERSRPCADLVRSIDMDPPKTAADLGCGPGNSTAVLKARWPQARIEGVDSSSEMLATARTSDPGIRWTESDLRSWRPDAPVDLLFSNAALQWVPDHASLLPRLWAFVAPRGALAFQVPIRGSPPPGWIGALDSVVREGSWTALELRDVAAENVLGSEEYYRLLAPVAERVDIWEVEYWHVLRGPAEVVDWTRGTALRPILEQLPDEGDRQRFLAQYGRAIEAAYRQQPDGRVLFPFRRRFVIAYRPA
jgi:trans-aconitate 2-methyltransferase